MAWHWLRDDSNSVCLVQVTLFVCYSSGWSSDCSVMAEAKWVSPPITWGNVLSLVGCSVGREVCRNPYSVNLLLSHMHTTHTQTLQCPPTHTQKNPAFLPLSGLCLNQQTATRTLRVRKWLTRLPNRLICLPFSSDIFAKAQEGAENLLPLLLPPFVWHTLPVVTELLSRKDLQLPWQDALPLWEPWVLPVWSE